LVSSLRITKYNYSLLQF